MITFLGILAGAVLGWLGGWFACGAVVKRDEIEAWQKAYRDALLRRQPKADIRTSAEAYRRAREQGWPL